MGASGAPFDMLHDVLEQDLGLEMHDRSRLRCRHIRGVSDDEHVFETVGREGLLVRRDEVQLVSQPTASDARITHVGRNRYEHVVIDFVFIPGDDLLLGTVDPPNGEVGSNRNPLSLEKFAQYPA